MQLIDIIIKKRNGIACSKKELEYVINEYTKGKLPDYQLTAFLMAVYFKGMTDDEMMSFTQIMMYSGVCYDLSDMGKFLVDKHSTGGVGDTVSLILAPMVAAAGVYVPMMSGRSLGHTGGTLDKIESIEGFNTVLSQEDFRNVLHTCGYAMISQSEHIVPADKKLYALRDVTGTVESIPLIVSSILSKKFAEGCQALVMDVKYGSGAFMKSIKQARELAQQLVKTAKQLGKVTISVLTPMEAPLGKMIGNFLEVEEAIHCLSPDYPDEHLSSDLIDLSIYLGGWMLYLAKLVKNQKEGVARCVQVLQQGLAWEHFCENVTLQGGNMDLLLKQVGTRRATLKKTISAPRAGIVTAIDAYILGTVATQIGAGREQQGDAILPDVGIELAVKPGDSVKEGDTIMTIWHEKERYEDNLLKILTHAIHIGSDNRSNTEHEQIFEVIQ